MIYSSRFILIDAVKTILTTLIKMIGGKYGDR